MTTPIRVLVVDDDASVQVSLAAYLEDEGFAVRSTGNVSEAMRILAAEPFDVAMVDLRLGEMDGESFILCAHEIQPATKFLIYTGSLGYQISERLADFGMKQGDVIYKPVRAMKVLTEQIRRVAGRKPNHGR